jgi:hypothetical protein
MPNLLPVQVLPVFPPHEPSLLTVRAVGEGAGVVTLDEDVLLEVEELDFELDELLELEDVVGFVLDEDELLEVVTDVDAFELVDVFEDVTNEPGVEVLLLDVDALLEEEEMDLLLIELDVTVVNETDDDLAEEEI